MNLNEVDWESLEKTWGFLFEDSDISNISKLARRYAYSNASEELVILVYAYEKFEGLIQK